MVRRSEPTDENQALKYTVTPASFLDIPRHPCMCKLYFFIFSFSDPFLLLLKANCLRSSDRVLEGLISSVGLER